MCTARCAGVKPMPGCATRSDRRRWLAAGLALLLATATTARADWTAPVAQPSVFALRAFALPGAPNWMHHSHSPALLVLFQPDCPFCERQFRQVEQFAARRPAVRVLAVALHGTPQALMFELRRAKATVPAYRASPELLRRLGNPATTPQVFLVDAGGHVIWQKRGLQLFDALESALAGRY
jgi:thiol-disulfide isomerase/thioredoxin